MGPKPTFARCARCNRLCGVMHVSKAQAGGWLAVLDRPCGCGAPAKRLMPATEDDARRSVHGGLVLPVRLVPDGWPDA